MNRDSIVHNTQAASSTLGYLLIVSMVLLSAGAIIVVGGQSIYQTQDTANQEAVDQAMTQLDSQMSLVAFQGGSKQKIDLSVDSNENIQIVDDGHITLELKEINETDPTDTKTVFTLIDRDISSLKYETTGDYTVSYQGGGVWGQRDDDPNKTRMVSPPEFTYNDRTAILPIVGIHPNSTVNSGSNGVTLTDSETEGIFPQHNQSEEYQNPISPEQDLVLTIQSEYYQSWGTYFEDRMGIKPLYHHDTNTIEVILVSETDGNTVSNAVTSVEGDDRITITGQGTETIIDSYNSDEGPYSESSGENGSVISESGITIQNGEVLGDITTNGDLFLRGNAYVMGDAAVDGNVQVRGAGRGSGNKKIGGEVTDAGEIDSFRPIDAIIESERESLIEDNNNDDDSHITNGSIGSEREFKAYNNETIIHTGDYYLANLTTTEDIVYNLEDGDITVLIDEEIDFEEVDIEVINADGNDHRVQIYTRSDLIKLGSVEVDGDRSSAMWFYGGAGTEAEVFESDQGTTGVIYAPGTSELPGSSTVHSHADMYGATISGNTVIDNHATYHYDEALETSQIFNEPHHVNHISARLSYFHVSYTEVGINVERE